ncbi:MAG: ABC transporter substrate-binding protein [Casimicrobiaceae bacterium]
MNSNIATFRLATATAAVAALAFAFAAQAAEPKRGGTLTYSYHPEPTALSTIATTAVPVAIASTKIFESLLEYEGPGLDPKPGLAESWTVSPDHLTYTFKLRSNVKWHDGKPFTSSDVKFSIEKIVRPLHSRGKVQFGNVTAIETPNPQTVVFKLGKPVPFFLKTFQPTETPMFPMHAFEGIDVNDSKAVRGAPFMQKPVGTGPFKLKEWKKGEYIILERNPDYWKPGKPYLDRIVLRVIPDAAARSIALENGEIDVAPMSAIAAADIERLGKLKNIAVSKAGNEGLGPNLWLEVNLRDKPLSDLRVRQAMSLALDREKIVDVIWFGQGKPAVGPIVSGNPYFNKSLKPYEYNPKKANDLLDQAGYPRGANGTRFKITQNVLPYGESWTRMAEYIKQDLSKIGIEVETQSLDLGGWLKKIYTDWDFGITSTFSHNYSDPSIGVQRTFVSSSIQKGATFTNSMGYVNPKVDELFAQALIETDPAKRRKEFDDVQVILHDELPVIFLMEMAYTHLYNKRVHDLTPNGIAMYSNWDSVWVD